MSMRFTAILLLVVGTIHAEVVDGIVATVNGQAVLKSDLEEAVRYAAFLGDFKITSALRNSTLDRLIDQELLMQQISGADVVQAAKQEIDDQIKELRRQHHADTQPEWIALLHGAGLAEKELRWRIGFQLKLARLVDKRLRPSANISQKSVEKYYTEKLLPKLRVAGAKEVPLALVSAKIKEVLIQQRINELLVAWLQTLHSRSEIKTTFQGSVAAGQSP